MAVTTNKPSNVLTRHLSNSQWLWCASHAPPSIRTSQLFLLAFGQVHMHKAASAFCFWKGRQMHYADSELLPFMQSALDVRRQHGLTVRSPIGGCGEDSIRAR
eukprot:6196829-Pleurochrysis_carterae.AAC.2